VYYIYYMYTCISIPLIVHGNNFKTSKSLRISRISIFHWFRRSKIGSGLSVFPDSSGFSIIYSILYLPPLIHTMSNHRQRISHFSTRLLPTISLLQYKNPPRCHFFFTFSLLLTSGPRGDVLTDFQR
jgi:hypothetical protein